MKYFIFSLLIVFSFSLKSQDFDSKKMDQLFDEIAVNDRGMGSISIYHKGEEVYQRSIGYENLASNQKSSAKTRYRIGSITKSFMATIIMQQVEEGKLSLSSKLSEFYPDFQNAETITIEHLLRHRSGLFNFTNDEGFVDYMELPQTQESLIKKMMINENNFEPGARMEYSNTGYVLLSYIAEIIDKKPFSQILEDRITNPQNLNDTYYGGKIGAKDYEAFGNWP